MVIGPRLLHGQRDCGGVGVRSAGTGHSDGVSLGGRWQREAGTAAYR